jgi:hypothetical protein
VLVYSTRSKPCNAFAFLPLSLLRLARCSSVVAHAILLAIEPLTIVLSAIVPDTRQN